MNADAPTADLIRTLSLATASARLQKAEDDPDSIGTLFGYLSVWGVESVIDSWEGRFREVWVKGAYQDTLRSGRTVQVMYDHGLDSAVGSRPLGKPSVLREDDHGLYIEVPLDDTSYNRDIAASLRSGALSGMSVRFSVMRERWDDPESKGALPLRTIESVELYEGGPVSFPAFEATSAGIRSREAYAAWRHARPTPPTPASRLSIPIATARGAARAFAEVTR